MSEGTYWDSKKQIYVKKIPKGFVSRGGLLKPQGWKQESVRHALAARGIKTGRKKLLAFVKEEKQTAKDYKRRGFIRQSKQEAEHAKFFEKKLKGVKKQ